MNFCGIQQISDKSLTTPPQPPLRAGAGPRAKFDSLKKLSPQGGGARCVGFVGYLGGWQFGLNPTVGTVGYVGFFGPLFFVK